MDLDKTGNKHILKRSVEHYHYKNPHHNKMSCAVDHLMFKFHYISVVLRIAASIGTSTAELTHEPPHLSSLGERVFLPIVCQVLPPTDERKNFMQS